MNKTISERIMLLYIPYYLETALSNMYLDVSVGAYWGPQYFNTLHREHIREKGECQGKYVTVCLFSSEQKKTRVKGRIPKEGVTLKL